MDSNLTHKAILMPFFWFVFYSWIECTLCLEALANHQTGGLPDVSECSHTSMPVRCFYFRCCCLYSRKAGKATSSICQPFEQHHVASPDICSNTDGICCALAGLYTLQSVESMLTSIQGPIFLPRISLKFSSNLSLIFIQGQETSLSVNKGIGLCSRWRGGISVARSNTTLRRAIRGVLFLLQDNLSP